MSRPDHDPMSEEKLDRALDDLLRGAFTPPPEAHFTDLARDVSQPVASAWPWRTLLLAAAALLVALGLWSRRPHEPHDPSADVPSLGAMWVAAYDEAVRDGNQHPSCCDPGCDVGQLCREVCGQALCHDGSGAVALVGSYKGGPVGGCAAFVMRADDATVCVFVMPQREDRAVELPRDRQLVVGRRELGDLVLYSVSRPLEIDALAGFALP